MQSISAVLPAYNEEDNIAATVNAVATALREMGSDYEVIVVDDGSADRTAEVVKSLSSTDSRIILQQHETNKGYGSALATGFAAATKELVFMTDGDGQFEISEIGRLLSELDEADIVVGYRAPRKDPFYRKLNAFGWNMLGTLLFGYTVRDVDCAFKLFRRSALVSVPVASRGATFSLELMVRAKRMGYRIAEVPVTHKPRAAGQQTGARLHVIQRAFKELFAFRAALAAEQ